MNISSYFICPKWACKVITRSEENGITYYTLVDIGQHAILMERDTDRTIFAEPVSTTQFV